MSQCQDFEVIAAGHICLDMFPRFMHSEPLKIYELMRPGTLVKMGEMAFSTGGAVSNTGIALKIFGMNVGYVAKVGKDAIGKTIIDILKKNGNAEGISMAQEEGSSYTVVIAPPGVDRIYLHCPGTNDSFVSADIDFSLVAKAKLFHFGYPTLMRSMYCDGGEELKRIFKCAKELGVTTSLDISLPDPNSEAGKVHWRDILSKVLPYVDIFLPSVEEAFFTLHPHDYLGRKAMHNNEELVDYLTAQEYSDLAKEFLDLGCKVIGLKSGHNGWYVKTAAEQLFRHFGKLKPSNVESWANKEIWCPAFKIDKIASATGSGDTSIAAFLSAISKNFDLITCLKYANCAGYMNLSALDALSGLGSWKEMDTLLPTLNLRDINLLHHTSWKFDTPNGVWVKEER